MKIGSYVRHVLARRRHGFSLVQGKQRKRKEGKNPSCTSWRFYKQSLVDDVKDVFTTGKYGMNNAKFVVYNLRKTELKSRG